MCTHSAITPAPEKTVDDLWIRVTATQLPTDGQEVWIFRHGEVSYGAFYAATKFIPAHFTCHTHRYYIQTTEFTFDSNGVTHWQPCDKPLPPGRSRPAWMTGSRENDFPGDFHLENGNYFNKCLTCGTDFIGYKRRHACRKCETDHAAYLAAMTPAEREAWTTAQCEKVKAYLKETKEPDNV